MSFVALHLHQKATLWRATGTLDGFGHPTYTSPVTIDCRWEERTTYIQAQDGSEVASRARVFLAVDVAAGDYLFLGTTTATNPRELPLTAFRILDFRKTPGLYAEQFERKAFL